MDFGKVGRPCARHANDENTKYSTCFSKNIDVLEMVKKMIVFFEVFVIGTIEVKHQEKFFGKNMVCVKIDFISI